MRVLGIVLILAPTAGCITLAVLVGQNMLGNPEMLMLLKVLMYLVVALIVIGIVLLMLLAVILVIGKGLGLSQGDTKAALGAAIALARNSSTLNRLYGRIPKGLLPPGYGPQQPHYQYPFGNMQQPGQVINGETGMPVDTEPASTSEAWER